MKAENRFKLVLDIRYGDGSGGVVYSFHYDPEGVILSFLTSLQDPDKEYATTGSWYNFYEIIDLKKNENYTNINKYIDAMYNEKNHDSYLLEDGLISLANREIYHKAVKKALDQADIYKRYYTENNNSRVTAHLRCWKCGKALNDANRSPLVYLSNPPRYACTDCDKDIIPSLPGEVKPV